MKRRFAVLCILLLCLALSGCHEKTSRSAYVAPDAFDTETQYEITFWAKNDTNKAQTRVYERAIEGFEVLYPNVKVNISLYTDYGKIYNDAITNIATNTTPNVCITYPDHIATYMTGDDVVVPLDNLFTNEKYGFGGSALLYDAPAMEEIVPEFLSECAINGTQYAIPYMRSTEALYINKTFVEKLGYRVPDVVTWDFVWEVSEAATAKAADGTYLVNGQKVMIPFIYKSTDNMMISMLKQLNAPYSAPDGSIGMFSEQTKEILYTVAQHAATGAFSTFKRSGYPANFLNAGQCIFAVDSTAGSTWMGCDAPLVDIAEDSIVSFETVVRPIPQFDTENPKMISQGPSICIFNKEDAQEVLASWLFAQYLLTDEVQTAYAQTEGYVSVTRKAQNSPEYQKYLSLSGTDNALHYAVKIDATKLLLENTENTFVTAVFNGSASLRDAAGQLIEDVTKSVYRRQAVTEASIEKLYSDTISLYRLNIEGGGNVKKELGPLPTGAVVLLCGIAATWVLLGIYTIRRRKKKL